MPKLKAADDGLTPETVTAPATPQTEEPAKAPEEPRTGSAIATSPQETAPAPASQSSARAYYAAAKVELAKIEQRISELDARREEVERVFQDQASSLTATRNATIAAIDIEAADVNLAWQMVMQKCKIYETAAAQDLRT